jgi:hypothetical protein
MTQNTRETLLTLGYIVAGLAGALLAGWMSAGTKFFHFSKASSLFLIVGFSAGLMYASARLRGPFSASLMVVLLYFIYIAASPPVRPSSVSSAAIFVVPVGLALLLSAYVLKALRRVPIGRFILMAVIVGLGYAVMLSVFLLRAHQHLAPNLILRQALLGVRLGGAVGLGLEIVDLVGRRNWPKPDPDLAPGTRRV